MSCWFMNTLNGNTTCSELSGFTIHWQGDITAETEERKPYEYHVKFLLSWQLHQHHKRKELHSQICTLWTHDSTRQWHLWYWMTLQLAKCTSKYTCEEEAKQGTVSHFLCRITVTMQIQVMHRQNVFLNRWFFEYLFVKLHAKMVHSYKMSDLLQSDFKDSVTKWISVHQYFPLHGSNYRG